MNPDMPRLLDEALVAEIRAEARAQGVRISDLATAAKRSTAAMNRYLSPRPEKRRPMSTEDIGRIAERLGMTQSELWIAAERRARRTSAPAPAPSPDWAQFVDDAEDRLRRPEDPPATQSGD